MQVSSQENVSITTTEYDITVNITNIYSSQQYRLGYGTVGDNLTWVDLNGGDAATYLLYNIIGRSPGATYQVKVERSGSEVYNQEVTTSMYQ